MDGQLLEHLRKITDEERSILAGRSSIDRALYMQGGGNTVNSRMLLSAGKLITVRPHTRFIPFPAHTHDYVEVVYMCEGSTTHTVNGTPIDLQQGELLFLSQSALHQVSRAEETDVAVNLIVLPSFFDTALAAMGQEETPLRRFLVDCLCGQNTGPGYLHFRVANVKPIQNLIENLLWSVLQETPNKRKTSQMTMALLFLLLMGNTDTLASQDQEDAATVKLLSYVESHYVTGTLTEAAQLLHYDLCWLSRQLKQKTGKTYTQLVQEKRLAQAAFLLRSTQRKVADISLAVGYENISYFHRIFSAAYGKSPKHYRDEAHLQERTLF